MKTVIEMAIKAGAIPIHKDYKQRALVGNKNIEAFAELVRADTRNATLDEIAKKIEAMPFGDTAASFAVWIREQKK